MELCFVKVSTTEKLYVTTQYVPRTVLLYVDNSKSWQILLWWLIGSAPDCRVSSPGFESGIFDNGPAGYVNVQYCKISGCRGIPLLPRP